MVEDVAAPRILVVEDEPALRRGLEEALRGAGYAVEAVASGAAGLAEARRPLYRLIVLDLMLPEVDGFEICRRLRREGVRTPIVVLTARGDEGDRVRGLDLGADDYVVKPFSLPELLARVRSVLRRAPGVEATGRVLRLGEVEVDLARCEVRRGGEAIPLSAREAAILEYLHSHRERVVGRRELLLKVWGYPDADLETRTVDTHMARLRRKIEPDPAAPLHLLTIRGMGYRLGEGSP